MHVEQEQRGAVQIIRPTGPLTADLVEDFTAAARDAARAATGRIVVDTSQVVYVDSEGLESLLVIAEQALAGGRLLKLCNSNETLREVLTLTGIAGMFDFYDDINSSIRSFL